MRVTRVTLATETLPAVRKVLKRFYYNLSNLNSVRNASHLMVNKVWMAWSKVQMSIARAAIRQVEIQHNTWLLLKRSSGCSSESQEQLGLGFISEQLLDIALAEAFTMICVTEDCDFRVNQRQERKMHLRQKTRS